MDLTLTAFTVLLLAGLTSAAPTSDVTLSSDFLKRFSIYTAEHDIVNLFCPFNSLSNNDSRDSITTEGLDVHLFFVLANVTSDVINYKGLYVLKNKKANKLLENGRDFAAKIDDTTVFIAATDGIYVYNSELNRAEKYGNVTDNFIGIGIANTTDEIYALTKDHVLYKITANGTLKEEVSDVKNAVQIVTDWENNLFYVDTHRNAYVKNSDGEIKKFEIRDLGEPSDFVKLIRPRIVDKGVALVIGNKICSIYPDGSNSIPMLDRLPQSSKFATAATPIHYISYRKEIFEYNFITMEFADLQAMRKALINLH